MALAEAAETEPVAPLQGSALTGLAELTAQWLTDSDQPCSVDLNDDGAIVAIRLGDWKAVFQENRAKAMQVWAEPFTELRLPKIFNLRTDPFERADITSNTYYDWLLDRAYLLVPAQAYVGQFLATFKDYPPRQKAASFSLDQVMEKLTPSGG